MVIIDFPFVDLWIFKFSHSKENNQISKKKTPLYHLSRTELITWGNLEQ